MKYLLTTNKQMVKVIQEVAKSGHSTGQENTSFSPSFGYSQGYRDGYCDGRIDMANSILTHSLILDIENEEEER